MNLSLTYSRDEMYQISMLEEQERKAQITMLLYISYLISFRVCIWGRKDKEFCFILDNRKIKGQVNCMTAPIITRI